MTRRGMICGKWLVRAALVNLLVFALTVIAQAAAPQEKSLEFQRIFIPDSPRDLLEKEMAKSGVKYLPVSREEFQELLRAVSAAPLGPGGASGKLTQASYSARLQGADLVGGEARLKLQHRVAEPAALALEPCTLSIVAPRWMKPRDLPARLGVDAGGRLAVLVEPDPASAADTNSTTSFDAELRFGWTLRGARDPSGALLFDLQIPVCTTSRLELDLPRGLTPLVEQGVVTMDTTAQTDQRQKWLIELGGFSKTTLTLVPSEELTKSHRYVLLKQAASYDLTAQSLEASFELDLDIYHEPLRQLSLDVDPELRITGVRLGDKEIPWTMAPAKDAARKLIVEFAEPLQGTDRTVRITGLAPMQWDQAWRLPTLRAEGVFWQEGTITLQTPPTLDLRDLVPQRCRQTKTSPLAAPRVGEVRLFQCLAAQGALSVVVSRPAVRLQLLSGLTLKWEEAEIQGRAVLDLTAEHGQTFQLRGAVPEGWAIDHVETVPAEALDDWSFEPAAEQASQLQVRLTQAISAQRGVRLVVLAHRRAPPPGQRLLPPEYRLVQFREVSRARQLVSVLVETQQQLDLAGDAGLTRLEPRLLTDNERVLLDTTASRLIFVDEAITPQFGLQVRDENARYAAQVNVTAELGPSSLTESYRIRCTPDTTGVSRVMVQITPRRAAALRWQIANETAGELTARLLTDEERRNTAIGDDEIWELTLKQPRKAAFELVAERSTSYPPDEPPTAVALAALPEAESQQGTVQVQATAEATPLVEAMGLTAITPAVSSSETTSPVRALFSYKPTQEQKLLISHISKASETPRLWAWRSLLTCRLNSDGRRVHTVRYELENTGRTSLELQLPPEIAPRDVHVNGSRVLPLEEKTSRRWRIPLPPTLRYVTLVVDYEDQIGELPLLGAVPHELPQIDCPVLNAEFRLCLPPSLALADAQHPERWGWLAMPDWRARLFGPLARQGHQPPPDLFALETWRRELGIDRHSLATQQRAAACWQAWEQLLTPARGTNRPATIGEWARRYDRLVAESTGVLPPLRIDESALAAANVYGDSKLPLSSSAANVSAAELFYNAHLVLLLTEDAVLLTTRSRILDEQLTASAILPTMFVDDRSTATELLTRLAPLKTPAWLAEPRRVRSPWLAEDASQWSELAASGWSVQTFAASTDGLRQVVVYRVGHVRAIALSLFLLVGGGVYWLLQAWPRLVLVALGASALLALVLPAPLAIWGAAALLGTLLAMIARLADRRPRAPVASTPASSMSHSVPKAMMTTSALLLAVYVSCYALTGMAQEPRAATTPATAPTVHRVLIPVDEQQQPSGKHVYLPQPFYEALYRQALAAKSAPQGWMIYDATYRGRLQWEKVGEKLSFAELVATYEIEVFQPGTRVAIGLGRESVHLLDDRVSLDDQLVRINWLDNGAGFLLPVEKAGRYRVELSLKPTVHISGAREEVDVQIPKLARSHLILKMPADATGVQTAGALGATTTSDAGEMQVELGPVEHLAVHWRTSDATAAPAGEIEATQLLWWRIRPGATTLEATWRFKSTGQPLREVRLVADPRLRLLPLDAKEPVAEQFVRDGDVKAIQFILKEPYEREVTLHTTFALTGSSGVGSLTLPQLDAVADRTTRRWLAVSTTASLDATLEPGSNPALLSAQEFLTAWGEAEATPQATYLLGNSGELVAFSVQPRDPIVTGEQSLVYSLRRDAVEIQLRAQFGVSDGQVFQHRIHVPAGLQIQSVQMVQAEATRPVRYALAPDQSLVAFLPGGMTGNYAVEVRGTLPLLGDGEHTLPLLACTEPAAQTAGVTIRRASEVDVTLERDPAAYHEDDNNVLAPDSSRWRTLARWQPVDPRQPAPIKLRTSANDHAWQAQQIVRVLRQGDAWQSQVDCLVDVARGTVDSLRFEVPADWSGPFRANVPATFQLVDVPGQTRRQLIVDLQQPQSQMFHVQINAPLTVAAGERLQAPEIALLDGNAVETFAILPTLAEEQAIGWETRGLQATELRPELREFAPANTQAFLVVGARYQATLRRVDTIVGVPKIQLADARLVRKADASYFGVVTFDLLPAGLTHVVLELPHGFKLVQVTVGDLPAVLRPLDDTHWQVLLHDEQLPQHIEVLFTSPHDSAAQSGEFLIPSFPGVPVERTLWTVLVDGQGSTLELTNPDLSLDTSRQTMFRLRNSAALLEQAAGVLSDSDDAEIAAWFVPWVRRDAAAQAWFVREESGRATPSVSLQNEMQSLAHDAQTVAQQWDVSDLVEHAAAESMFASDLTDDLLASHPPEAPPILAMIPGPSTSLSLEGTTGVSTPLWPRVLAAISITIVLVGLGRLWRLPLTADILARWPQLLGVTIALAWWMFLQPAWVAMVLLLLLVMVSLRWPWPTTGEPLVASFSSRVLRYRSRR